MVEDNLVDLQKKLGGLKEGLKNSKKGSSEEEKYIAGINEVVNKIRNRYQILTDDLVKEEDKRNSDEKKIKKYKEELNRYEDIISELKFEGDRDETKTERERAEQKAEFFKLIILRKRAQLEKTNRRIAELEKLIKEYKKVAKENDINLTLGILGGVGGSVVTVVIAVIIYLLYKRWKKGKRKTSTERKKRRKRKCVYIDEE